MSFFQGIKRTKKPSHSDSDEEDHPKTVTTTKKIEFRCTEPLKNTFSSDLFVLDSDGDSNEDSKEEPEPPKVSQQPKQSKKKSVIPENILEDPDVKKLMSKSVVRPGFDSKPAEEVVLKSRRRMKKERKEQRKQTAGRDWFDMPATELTEERKQDLELLQMRNALDSATFYKKSDRQTLPKYFQVGKIVETKADFYSGRLTKKERKRTLLEEMMGDYKTLEKTKKKFDDIRARKAKVKKLGSSAPITMSKTKRRALKKTKS
ncbi:hypothetical protein FO519_008080 [Halicephalobus sp. NKZ332]|nr:hypothetical protein FO519_008080 [Halicephalobus sp. NKZ332]